MTFKARIYFHDEAPRLGCGVRTVTIRIGRKWVRISDHMGRAVRFHRRVYEQLNLRPEVLS